MKSVPFLLENFLISLILLLATTGSVSAQTTSTWNFCAAEDGICSFTGTLRVRYGAQGLYAILTKTNSVPCNNATFGDPVFGFDKTCEYETITIAAPPPPPSTITTTQNAIENAKSGTTSWLLANPAINGEIEGYASATSVNRGDTISFYVNTAAASYTMDIYRLGYYGGTGARLVRSLPSTTGIQQIKPCTNPAGIIECNWSAQNTLSIPASSNDPKDLNFWPSGIYLAKMTTSAPINDSYIVFVVRDDLRAAVFVAQLPITTYEAYNFWGGKSLYTGCAIHDKNWNCANGARPANAVSFNRPFGPSTNPQAKYGVGAGEFITNVQPVLEGYPISSAGFDYNMLRWMEAQGYDVKYISSIDLHQQTGVFQNASAFVSIGHDEYYSSVMRDRIVTARDSGLNLLFISSNQAYWQVRFEAGSYGINKNDRTMAGYRQGGDPVTTTGLTTGKFRDLGRPEASFIGSQYVADPINGSVTITNASHWLYTATGAVNNQNLAGLLGYEINAITPGVSPANIVSLAKSSSGGFFSDMTYYLAPSLAHVIATGTMQWSWGLDNFISNYLRNDYSSAVAQKMTANMFSAAGENELFRLKNIANGLSLGTVSGSTTKGQIIVTSATGKSGQWRIKDYGDTTQQLVSRATAYCMDAYGATAGSITGLWECNNANQQHWLFTSNLDGNITIRDRRSNMCLTAPAGAVNGSGIVMGNCTGSNSQLWKKTAL